MNKYQKYNMLNSEITKVGHKFTADNGEGSVMIRFAAVRGSWAWPADESPFYWCIVGQEYVDIDLYEVTNPNFELIAEGLDQGLDLEERFHALADDAALYLCDFYADLSAIHEPEAEAYYDFLSKHSYKYGYLSFAPYMDNFRLGVELIKSQIRTRRLDLPNDTQVFDQLSRITEADLADPDVQKRFFAIEALRHVVASFKRDPEVHQQPQMPTSRNTPHPQGWMA